MDNKIQTMPSVLFASATCYMIRENNDKEKSF